MKLVANIKLVPTDEQFEALKETLERANDACNWISERAWETKTFGQYKLHKLVYREVRSIFGLTAQVAVRCIAKVADAYKTDRKTMRKFRNHAAQPFDDRIFRFCSDIEVSIWTLQGRQRIVYQCGKRQRILLEHRNGEVDLMFIRGNFYLACVCDIDDPEWIKTKDVLGVDVGIVNIATDSEGKNYSGQRIENIRRKHAHRRKNLQKKGTRSAKRKLKKISGKQKRFQKDVNHCISKGIVKDAQRSGSVIALEDLKGIRDRVKASKRQRARLSNWQFGQLHAFIEYKAKLHGVPVIYVDPKYTSQMCPKCQHVSRSNRKTRDNFKCTQCGFAGPADAIAALNIKARAQVNEPMVASDP